MFRKRVLSGVCVLLILGAGGLLVADSSEDVKDESDVDIRVRCAAKALEIARVDYEEAADAKKKVPAAVSDAEFERRRLTVEIAELSVEKLRSELAYELRLAEMEVRRAADKAETARNAFDSMKKAIRKQCVYVGKFEFQRRQLHSELAALELERARRRLETERIFRQPGPGSLETESQ